MALTRINNQALSNLTFEKARMPAGSVLQVVQAVEDDSLNYTDGNTEQILTLTITPSSSTSKIMLMSHAHCSSITRYHHAKLKRKIGTGSFTLIANGDTSSETSRDGAWFTFGTNDDDSVAAIRYVQHNGSGFYLDSPSTSSQLTYSLEIGVREAAQSGYAFSVNGATADHDINEWWNTAVITTLTAMEIAG